MTNKINFFGFLKLITTVCVGVFILKYAFSYKKSDQPLTQNQFENVNWETEKSSIYKLIRPIEYEQYVSDVYGLPIVSGDWYLISGRNQCYLMPVKTHFGTGSDFVDNVTSESNTLAIIDTMYAGSMSGVNTFIGLMGIKKVEILCFKDYTIKPKQGLNGEITVEAVKR